MNPIQEVIIDHLQDLKSQHGIIFNRPSGLIKVTLIQNQYPVIKQVLNEYCSVKPQNYRLWIHLDRIHILALYPNRQPDGFNIESDRDFFNYIKLTII